MLSEELLRKVHRIEIKTRKMVNDVMSGHYRTQFKGQGMQFSEHRLYVPGDDIRHIDWKVTARTRDPMVKKYEEERELTVLLVVDISGSKAFGSSKKLKSEVAAEIAAMLAYAAIHTGDKVGILLFAEKVEKILPPGKGKQHVLRIIQEVLTHIPETQGTSLKVALESAGRLMKHSGVIFVLSDFLAQDYDRSLLRLSKRHDVITLIVRDQREVQVPAVGFLLLRDPETGIESLVNTQSYAFKKWLREFQTKREAEFQSLAKGGKIELLRMTTQEDYAEALVRFFRVRAQRKSQRKRR